MASPSADKLKFKAISQGTHGNIYLVPNFEGGHRNTYCSIQRRASYTTGRVNPSMHYTA